MLLVRSRVILMVAIAGLLVSLGINVWQVAQLSDERNRRAANERSLVQEEQRLRDLEHRAAPVAGAAKEPEKTERPRGAAREAREQGPGSAEAVLLQQELDDARRQIGDLEASQTALQEAQQTAASDASQRFASAQKDWNDRLDSLTRELESARADLQSSKQNAAEAKSANDRLKDAQANSAARAAETARMVASLQDLNRRRDSYLTSLIRRYRDVSNQFRAMSGMLDSNRGPSASAMSESALTRIQSTVSQAEDDLRQLNEVSARVQQLEKKLNTFLKAQATSGSSGAANP
ncbi:MAG: hypothetical protein ACRD9L_28985 [Bryobacteraceae bacterium]